MLIIERLMIFNNHIATEIWSTNTILFQLHIYTYVTDILYPDIDANYHGFFKLYRLCR